MKDWIGEFQDLFGTLIADVEDLSRFAHGGSLHASRSYVRAVFALIEGITYAMKQVAASPFLMPLDAAERALLNEESYALDPSGKPQTRSAYLQLLPNVRFAFAAMAKCHGADFIVDVSGSGWQSLQRAIQVRHRLMHPKAATDLELDQRELDDVGIAFRWFVGNVALCLRTIVLALSATTKSEVPSDFLDRIEKYYSAFAK
jgi:hypothetical protein